MSVSEDRELFGWCTAARRYGGEFGAAFFADDDNYALMRPTLLAFKAKYPKYDDMDEDREDARIAHLGGSE